MFSAFVVGHRCLCGDSKNEGWQRLAQMHIRVYIRVCLRSCLRSVCKFASLVSCLSSHFQTGTVDVSAGNYDSAVQRLGGKNERHRRTTRIREREREIWAEPDAQVYQ